MRDNSGNTAIGDGIAIGTNIKINVDKRSYHQSSGGGGSNGGSGDTDPRALFGLVFVVVIGVAFASWQFARHAPTVYFALALCAAASIAILGTATGWRVYCGASWPEVASPFAAAIAGALVLAALVLSRKTYPIELTTFALQSSGWKAFFCGLAPAWREFAAMQMVAIGLVAAPATLLLCVYSTGTAISELAYGGPVFFHRIADSMTTKGLLVGSISLSVLALVAQSGVAADAWTMYVSPQLEPFFSHGGAPFSFCHR